jgi:phosphatidate cytidylyltransferase
MLGQRVVTAVVLLALLVPALFASVAWPFSVLTLLLIGAGGWEWARLNQAGAALSVAMAVLLTLACAALLLFGLPDAAWPMVWSAGAALWVIGGALALRSGPTRWPNWSPPLRWLLGALVLGCAWLAVVQARAIGVNYILSVFCLVWVADIAAYFGGRRFGKRKLAPSISPGKSWEGVYSGMVGVLLLSVAWSALELRIATDSDSLFTLLRQHFGLVGQLVALAGLAGMSVVGDLFESLVKRAAGAKDSSRLLPGHGGVLDRLDALLPVFPLAMALVAW